MIRKKISSITLDISIYSLNTDEIEKADIICEQIAEFTFAKFLELNPELRPNVNINKRMQYFDDDEENPFK